MNDVRNWFGDNNPTNSIRLMRIDVSEFPKISTSRSSGVINEYLVPTILLRMTEKLDSSNGNKKSDGINYWKGKKIISLEEWFNISKTYFLSNPDKHKIKEGLVYLPNGYCEMIFPLGVPDEIIENVNEWHRHYIELMDYMKNPDFG